MLSEMGRVDLSDHDRIWKLKQDLTVETIKELGKEDKSKVEMFKWLKSEGIKTACVTNSILMTAKLMLFVTGQEKYLDLIISNEDVNIPKPHPEGYIRAMIFFNSFPQKTVIVEDSEYGIQAANNTGAHVMKVMCAKDVCKDSVSKFIGGKNG
jgi:HAD superfamily hydrolase (TIGR01509 family)